MYQPVRPIDPEREFDAIAKQLTGMFDGIRFRVLSAEPGRKNRGDVVYADGTTWDPGSGEGLYRYTGAAWVFVG